LSARAAPVFSSSATTVYNREKENASLRAFLSQAHFSHTKKKENMDPLDRVDSQQQASTSSQVSIEDVDFSALQLEWMEKFDAVLARLHESYQTIEDLRRNLALRCSENEQLLAYLSSQRYENEQLQDQLNTRDCVIIELKKLVAVSIATLADLNDQRKPNK
jgi:hypothetical protein